ncbi:hypothetical protein FACS1894166_09150 [Bacilli bacterium]|nr:hypothetical protein FACS1894166_09150 [Bacilli bacterium]
MASKAKGSKDSKFNRIKTALLIVATTGGVLGLVGGTFGITYSLAKGKDNGGGGTTDSKTTYTVNGDNSLVLDSKSVSLQYTCTSSANEGTNGTFSFDGDLPQGLTLSEKGKLSGTYSGINGRNGSFSITCSVDGTKSNPFIVN